MKKIVSTLSSLILEFWVLLSHLLYTNRLKHKVNRSSGYPFCEKTPFRKPTSCENVSQLQLSMFCLLFCVFLFVGASWQFYFRKCKIHTWIYCQEFENAMPHAYTCIHSHTHPLLAYPFSHSHLHTLTCSHSLLNIFCLISLGYHRVHINVKLHT